MHNNAVWTSPELPESLQYGDMPGDVVSIDDRHLLIANRIFPALLDIVTAFGEQNTRTVLGVCGGSGVGKTEVSTLLSFHFTKMGVMSYTLSGDNYVRRIPKYNDAERLRIFREGGVHGLVRNGTYTSEHAAILRRLQGAEDDANPTNSEVYPWMSLYISQGRKALEGYLGTPNEIDFILLSNIIDSFKDGDESIWLRRLGRDDTALWYDLVRFEHRHILIIEWTHANSGYLRGVDIPIVLHSTPQETLEHRKRRNRDAKADSPFTAMVLEIEQQRLISQLPTAKLIVSKNGELMGSDDFMESCQ